jgi:hypothetical protein
MSATILGGDVTIYYQDENRQKRLAWTGSASGTRTMNELYSALQDHFDEVSQMDDGIPMSAQTPVEYTIGIIDSGDLDPWYVSYSMMEHMTSGALKTSGWARVTNTNVGIVVVSVTSNTIVTGDIGLAISHAGTDTGTLLDVIEGGTTDYLVIRPTAFTTTHDWDSTSGTITCNAHTATQSAAAVTGEQIWANLYSIGTIEPDTHVYVYQGAVADNSRARLYSITDATQDWWGDGHIDICPFTKNFRVAGFPAIDAGYLTVYARKANTLYDSFEASTSLTSGGRNPIPLGTSPDLDNTTGYKSITFTAASGNWAVGNEITGATSLARAIITDIVSPGATQVIHYYLLGDPLTDFQTAAETINNVDDTGTGTKNGSAPADQGPALQAWFTNNAFPTLTYTSTTYDVDDNGTPESYGITLDCNQNPLSEVYEWIKYVTRFGATGTGNTDGVPGESYIGGEVYLAYSGAVTGLISEGSDVTQAVSGATGIVISHDTVNKIILLRNTRGTFVTAQVLTDNDTSGTVTINTAASTFSPKKTSPIGTFAGGTFFGARGVLLADWLAANENQFQLTPIAGGTQSRPIAITISVTNLVGTSEATLDDDRVSVFRLTGSGGSINKTEFSAAGGEIIGAATLVVDGSIPQDVPGKTTGGSLRIRDASANNAGYRIRYSSWSGSTFTLANIVVASADGGTNTTTIVESGAFATAKRGDIVVNHTRGEAVSYVTAVVDANTITISPAIASQTSTDSIELNCVPIAMNTADDIFVPLLDKYAISTEASTSIVYIAPVYFRVVVRNSANATPILPFTTDSSTTGSNASVATIRTTDTIKT